MFAILHNLAVNQYRQTAVRGVHMTLDEADENVFSLKPLQEQNLLYMDVLQKLAGLPDEQRSVILLVAVEDLSYADAASVLNIPVGTVMSRLSRARERLQQEVEGEAHIVPQKVAHLRSIK